MTESKIIRKKRTTKFTVLNNDIFDETKGRTLKSLGLLCYLLHLPDDWNISKSDLNKRFKDKRFSIDGAIDELVENGYMQIVNRRNKGKFDGVDYYVFDEPIARNPQADKPQPINPQAGKQQLLSNNSKQELINKELSVNSKEELTGAEPFSHKEPEIKKEGKEKKVAPKKEKLYQMLMDVYWNWFKTRNDNIEPKIDAIEGSSLKKLCVYLESVARAKHPGKDEDEINFAAAGILEYIFGKWDSLEPFLQKQVKLVQINSNITNIINDLKNGRKTQTAQQQKQNRGAVLNEVFNGIDEYYNGQQS